jgi:hypothetical protein
MKNLEGYMHSYMNCFSKKFVLFLTFPFRLNLETEDQTIIISKSKPEILNSLNAKFNHYQWKEMPFVDLFPEKKLPAPISLRKKKSCILGQNKESNPEVIKKN